MFSPKVDPLINVQPNEKSSTRYYMLRKTIYPTVKGDSPMYANNDGGKTITLDAPRKTPRTRSRNLILTARVLVVICTVVFNAIYWYVSLNEWEV